MLLLHPPPRQDGILEKAATAVKEDNVNLLMIDPYNFIERSQVSETNKKIGKNWLFVCFFWRFERGGWKCRRPGHTEMGPFFFSNRL